VTAAAPILEIRHLTVVFGTTHGDRTAVQDISLSVPAGATVALVGESGSGKSTTAAAVNRLLPPNGRVTSGSIELDGRELLALGERDMRRIRGAGIGLVPQDPMSNLDPLMRIGDQVAEALEVHDVATGKAAWARAVELLELVGIPDPTDRAAQYPHEFSGGMRQRALIAMGLACRPRLLVADEPTSALDVTVQRRILDTVDAITDELGTSVLLITHDLGLAAERADTVAVMYRGEIVETGPAARILAEPEHAYTRRLLAAAPSLNSVRDVRRTRDDSVAAEPLVRFEGVGKRFALRRRGGGAGEDILAVDDVSFGIPHGQTVAIVGESGSGKSTTANLLLGLEIPTSGRILVGDQDLATMSRRETFALRRRIQPVFQNPYASLDPRYTVERSVAEPLKVHGVGSPDERRERVRTLLDQVALDADLAARLPHELSGGQRQRVAIARALALEPDIVVLDEAVSALDVIVQAQILELLADLQDRLGLTYLFISHDLAVVRMVSDQVHVMRAGRLVESGPPDQIFAAPRDDHTRELLAAIPGAERRTSWRD
jgi:peptide/nickel transport system ATP-binding protein